MSEHILVADAERIRTITFNRPEARNAISREMIQQLISIMRSADADPSVRCLVFRGAGEHFSGGGDVKAFGETLGLAPDERRRLYRERVEASAELFAQIDAFPKPILAIARGAVAGAGLSFVMAADVAIASDTTFCVFAHTKIGIAPDSALSYFLPRVVGVRKSRELTLTGARLSAEEALKLGILSRVIPDADLDATAGKIAASLTSGSALAMRYSKTLLNQANTRDIRMQVLAEAQAVGECAATEDFPEGIRAFQEGRRPKFS